MTARNGIDDPEYVQRKKAQWSAQGIAPISMMVVEYCGTGDPAFGGSADDRALGPDDRILTWKESLSEIPLVFSNIDDAHEAAKRIVNRRPNSLLGLSNCWR